VALETVAMSKPNDYKERNQGRPYDEVITELEGRVVILEAFLHWDKELRKQNPALQDLFDKYQATKKLIT